MSNPNAQLELLQLQDSFCSQIVHVQESAITAPRIVSDMPL